MGTLGTARKLWDKKDFQQRVQDILADSKDQSYTAMMIGHAAYQYYLEIHGKLETWKRVKDLDNDGSYRVTDIARICGISSTTVVAIKQNEWM